MKAGVRAFGPEGLIVVGSLGVVANLGDGLRRDEARSVLRR
jgi:hypothetical protein